MSQFRSPLIYVLLAAAAISFVVGKHHDPYVILGIVLLNALIGFFQEWQAARSFDAEARQRFEAAAIALAGQA